MRVLPIVFLLLGCASTPLRFYAGPELPDDHVAVVSFPNIFLTRLRDGSGKLLWSGDLEDARIALRPGTYRLELYARAVVWTDFDLPATTDVYTIDFNARPNHQYLLKARVFGAFRASRHPRPGDIDPGMCCDPTAADLDAVLIDAATGTTIAKSRLR